MTVDEMITLIAQRIKLVDTVGFALLDCSNGKGSPPHSLALFQRDPPDHMITDRVISRGAYLFDLITGEPLPTLVFRRRLHLHPREYPDQPAEVKLLYAQVPPISLPDHIICHSYLLSVSGLLTALSDAGGDTKRAASGERGGAAGPVGFAVQGGAGEEGRRQELLREALRARVPYRPPLRRRLAQPHSAEGLVDFFFFLNLYLF